MDERREGDGEHGSIADENAWLHRNEIFELIHI